VKLFRRNKQEQDARVKPANPLLLQLRELLPGLGAAAAGLLAAILVLWFGLISESRQHQLEQMSQAWGGTQARVIQAALGQLEQDTRVAAASPQVLQALHSGDSGQLRSIEQQLGYRELVVDVHLTPTGQGKVDSSRDGPMNFAALDLLRRVEGGKPAAPEAYRVGKRWLVYSGAPVRASEQGKVEGTLIMVIDLQRLLQLLPALPAGAGQLRVIQQFGSSPEQILATLGQPGSSAPMDIQSSHPNWHFSFTPGEDLTVTLASPWLLLLALLLAFTGAAIGIWLAQRKCAQSVSQDARQLQHMLAEISFGKQISPAHLRSPELHSLGIALADLSRRRRDQAATGPVSGSSDEPAALLGDDFQLPDEFSLDLDIRDEGPEPATNGTRRSVEPVKGASEVPAGIFRAYDIRGVVGDTLTLDHAYWIGRAVGSQSLAQGEPGVIVGRDGRHSGEALSQALIRGLLDCGCHVIDTGMLPTPALYYATHELNARSGVMVTGSHNPPDYNGFKIVIAGDTLANESIVALHTRIVKGDLAVGQGRLEQQQILQSYFQRIRDDIAIARPLKVVVDCGNGVAGVIAPQLLEAIGCEVIPLYCDVDGSFPNHHPDPGQPENLQDLIARVAAEQADLGLAFDGDGDRLGVVTNSGRIIYPDRLMMLFARDVISRNPGADIIFDVKCSRQLGALISSYGGRPVMWKTGHSLIKKKMKETGALLAGEMSGHIFFKERWYGFDDGIYSAARLLEILSLDGDSVDQVFNEFPSSLSTPEINIKVTDARKFELIDLLQREAQWGNANLTTLDGVRVDYQKGWGLVRASNTTPVLVLRFEADTAEELARIQTTFRTQLQRFAPDLDPPF
jgi:phosphomannomutase/phosphoglucomutase